MKTEAQVRAAFWQSHPSIQRRHTVASNGRIIRAPQNQQPVDTRVAFVDYVDSLERNGVITEALASRVTL